MSGSLRLALAALAAFAVSFVVVAAAAGGGSSAKPAPPAVRADDIRGGAAQARREPGRRCAPGSAPRASAGWSRSHSAARRSAAPRSAAQPVLPPHARRPPRRPSPQCRRHPRRRRRPHPRPPAAARPGAAATTPDLRRFRMSAAVKTAARKPAPGAVIDGYTIERELHDHPAAELRYAVFGPDWLARDADGVVAPVHGEGREHALPPARRAPRQAPPPGRDPSTRDRRAWRSSGPGHGRVSRAHLRGRPGGRGAARAGARRRHARPGGRRSRYRRLPCARPQEPERAQPAARRRRPPSPGHLRAPDRRGRSGAHDRRGTRPSLPPARAGSG